MRRRRIDHRRVGLRPKPPGLCAGFVLALSAAHVVRDGREHLLRKIAQRFLVQASGGRLQRRGEAIPLGEDAFPIGIDEVRHHHCASPTAIVGFVVSIAHGRGSLSLSARG